MKNPPPPIRAYHGAGCSITEFDYKFTEKGNDQLGSGFYFTTDIVEAQRYTTATINELPKPGGMDAPTVHVADLMLVNPLQSDHIQSIRVEQALRIISAAPRLDEMLEDWGDISHEGRTKVLARAARSYSGFECELIRRLNDMSNDFFKGAIREFNTAVREVLGFDGVVAKQVGETVHYVAWFPEQISIVERIAYAPESAAAFDPGTSRRPSP